MTNEELDLFKKAILDSTEAYVDARFETLPFVKTEIGVIEGVGTNPNTNKVRINKIVDTDGTVIKEGALYDNVLSIGKIVYPIGSVVYIFVPNSQYTNMFIMGQLNPTPSNIVGGSINIGNIGESGWSYFSVDKNGDVYIYNPKIENGIKFWYYDRYNPKDSNYQDMIYVDNLGEFYDLPHLVFDYVPSIFRYGVEFNNGFSCNSNANFYGNVYNASGGVVFKSDKNAKHDIESLDLEKSANFIYSQNPVSYKFNNGTSDRKHHGFIAQEVKETMGDEDWGIYIDQSMGEKDKIKDETNFIGLRYDEYIADIIATCQYQKQQIDELKQQMEEMKKEISELKGENNNGND